MVGKQSANCLYVCMSGGGRGGQDQLFNPHQCFLLTAEWAFPIAQPGEARMESCLKKQY